MKTTINLPDDLVRKLKFRAVRERRKFKDLTAELLRAALSGPQNELRNVKRPVIATDKRTGLPMIRCPRAPAVPQPTPDQIAQLLFDGEVDRYVASS